jgi:hypothetical protein
MDFVGFVALAGLAIVFFTRPTDNVWFKVGGAACALYALFCLYRGITRSEESSD